MPIHDAKSRIGGAKLPASAHPAFPAVVSLWFAALLGIGSLIVPVRLYEALLTATGITGIIESANPPLGFAARTLIALAATVLGAALGFMAARRLIGSQGYSFASKRNDEGRRPLNPVEDIDEVGIDDDLPPIREMPTTTGRRRALAITEEPDHGGAPDVVPLPGEDYDPYALADEHLGQDLDSHLGSDDDFLELDAELEPDDLPFERDFSDPDPRQELRPPATEATTLKAQFEIPESPAALVPPFASGEPLPFSPPSMARAEPAAAPATLSGQTFLNPVSPRLFDMPGAAAPVTSQAQMEIPAETAAPEPDSFESDVPVAAGPTNASEESVSETPYTPDEERPETSGQTPADESIAGRDGEHADGLVQLVQKLGSTLEKHRAWSAERGPQKNPAPAGSTQTTQTAVPYAERNEVPGAASPGQPVSQNFDPAAPDEAAEAMAAFFGKPAQGRVDGTDDDGEQACDAPETRPAPSDQPKQVFRTPQPNSARDDSDATEGDAAPVTSPGAPASDSGGQRYAPFKNLSHFVGDDEDEDDIGDLAQTFQLPVSIRSQEKPAASEPSARPAFDIPPASARMARPPATEPSPAPAPARDSTSDYQAISASNPFKANAEDFVRIDTPEPETAQPAVVFPNQQPEARGRDMLPSGGSAEPAPRGASAAASDENERALREALMNLQRMGK